MDINNGRGNKQHRINKTLNSGNLTEKTEVYCTASTSYHGRPSQSQYGPAKIAGFDTPSTAQAEDIFASFWLVYGGWILTVVAILGIRITASAYSQLLIGVGAAEIAIFIFFPNPVFLFGGMLLVIIGIGLKLINM